MNREDYLTDYRQLEGDVKKDFVRDVFEWCFPAPEDAALLREIGVSITPIEGDILAALMHRIGNVVTLERICGYLDPDGFIDPVQNVLASQSHIKRLRPKIRKFGATIKTIYGQGYVMTDPGTLRYNARDQAMTRLFEEAEFLRREYHREIGRDDP